jgi:hypothetical protein
MFAEAIKMKPPIITHAVMSLPSPGWVADVMDITNTPIKRITDSFNPSIKL